MVMHQNTVSITDGAMTLSKCSPKRSPILQLGNNVIAPLAFNSPTCKMATGHGLLGMCVMAEVVSDKKYRKLALSIVTKYMKN